MVEDAVRRRSRPVARWLLVGVAMIIVQIILGGITRLTDSGLSITEWQPLLGAVPPTTDAQWNKAFEGYKQIAQYKNLHSYFTLDDFKSIFFWEWLHRFLGAIDRYCFRHSIHHLSFTKAYYYKDDCAADYFIFSWRNAGKNRLVNGEKRV